MSISEADFIQILEKEFPNSDFVVKDTNCDQNHYSVKIVSCEFNGLSPLKMHRLVNERLKGIVGERVHAVTFDLSTK